MWVSVGECGWVWGVWVSVGECGGVWVVVGDKVYVHIRGGGQTVVRANSSQQKTVFTGVK